MISKINRYGYVCANNYRVVFSGIAGIGDQVIGSPAGSSISDGTDKKKGLFDTRLSLSCESVTLPGRSLATNEFKTIGIGIEVPYERLFGGDIEMTFIFGKDMQERKIFESWMNTIISNTNNRFGYYDNYVAQADIILFDETDNPVYKSKIEEIYPKEIGAISLSNESSDLARQSITFSYKKYTPIDISLSNPSMSDTTPISRTNEEVIHRNIQEKTTLHTHTKIKGGEKYAHDGAVKIALPYDKSYYGLNDVDEEMTDLGW